MLSFGGALHWVRETGAQYFGPILDDLRYDFELRKPQRERQRNEDEFNEAISAEKDPRNKEDLIRTCLQLRRERIGIGRRTFCVSDARGFPKSANV